MLRSEYCDSAVGVIDYITEHDKLAFLLYFVDTSDEYDYHYKTLLKHQIYPQKYCAFAKSGFQGPCQTCHIIGYCII
uniref:Uncharacterized protein n=1 Tax=Acrobeloides nanus TaxID=290746 RepID=A0A914EA05_9BILA